MNQALKMKDVVPLIFLMMKAICSMTWHTAVKKKNKPLLEKDLPSSNNGFSGFCHKENKKYYIDVIISEGKGEPTVEFTQRVKNSSTFGNTHMIPARQKLMTL
jgi:hypothetical protein